MTIKNRLNILKNTVKGYFPQQISIEDKTVNQIITYLINEKTPFERHQLIFKVLDRLIDENELEIKRHELVNVETVEYINKLKSLNWKL